MTATLVSGSQATWAGTVLDLQPEEHIRAYFAALYEHWGRQHWWPAHCAFEVIVGAYLTQNTSWTNVERALSGLRAVRVLSVAGIRRTPLPELERLIRAAGYFRQKARRLKIFVRFLDKRYAGSLAKMFAEPTAKLRQELLELEGVGPETADSILLYAGNHPVFVVDAYTRRVMERHHLMAEDATYEEIRELFERGLVQVPEKSLALTCDRKGAPGTCHAPSRMSTAKRAYAVQVFNEMHGLIVGVGKNYCKKSQPDCEHCPLQKFLPGPQ